MSNLSTQFISEPVLNTSLMLLSNCTSQEALAHLEAKGVNCGDTSFTAGHGWTYDVRPSHNKQGHEFRAMWLGKSDPALIAHEASHLVMSTFADAGIPISNENGETFAYFLGWWVKAVSQALSTSTSSGNTKASRSQSKEKP